MICKRCGTEINTKIREADGSVVCLGCGAVYRPKSAPTQEQRPAASSAAESRPPRTENTHRKSSQPRRAAKRSGAGLKVAIAIFAAVLVIGGTIGLILHFRGRETTAPAPVAEQIVISYLQSRSTYYYENEADETPSGFSRISYEYYPDGMFRSMTITQTDAEPIIVTYNYEYGEKGFPIKMWTSVECTDKGGQKYIFDDYNKFIADMDAGVYNDTDIDDFALYLLRSEIDNTFGDDGSSQARLHDLEMGGRILDSKDGLGIAAQNALDAILSPFARSPRYYNTNVSWGESAIVLEGVSNIITTTDSEGFINSLIINDGEEKTIFKIERVVRDDSVLVRAIHPDTGEIGIEYLYDKNGNLLEMAMYSGSDIQQKSEYDQNGKEIRRTVFYRGWGIEKYVYEVQYGELLLSDLATGSTDKMNPLTESNTPDADGENIVVGADEPETPQNTATPVQQQEISTQDDLAAELFSAIPPKYTYWSGAGSWSTDITINPDGSFTGEYHNIDFSEGSDGYDGTLGKAEFSGRFVNVQEINEYIYSFRLDGLTYSQEIGTEDVTDLYNNGSRYLVQYSSALGIDDGTTFYLYKKGAAADQLPQRFVEWIKMFVDFDLIDGEMRLPVYGIYNSDGDAAFYASPYDLENAAETSASAQGTLVSLSSAEQYAINIFLSNFSEQSAFYPNGFDINNWNLADVVDFAYLYCKINRHSAIGHESDYYTVSLDTVNNVLNRHFGFMLSEDQVASLPRSDRGFDHYSAGTFYFIAADGEAYSRFTVVKQMEQLSDGTYRATFDNYYLDVNVYFNDNGVDSSYYYLTTNEAENRTDLTRTASGIAIVRPYDNNGIQTYQLISYQIHK